jgi:hypothetical protein
MPHVVGIEYPNHNVALSDLPWSATSGGCKGSPAMRICVRPKDASTSDSVTGMMLAARVASYSWQYAARAIRPKRRDSGHGTPPGQPARRRPN